MTWGIALTMIPVHTIRIPVQLNHFSLYVKWKWKIRVLFTKKKLPV